ncbi:MAG: DUF4328 domain-containing protein [Magnetococcales bacterium]|nr:DUF4328 domain-containing protein [Magnetococcales bacterium]
MYQFNKDPTGLNRWLIVFLWVSVAVNSLALLHDGALTLGFLFPGGFAGMGEAWIDSLIYLSAVVFFLTFGVFLRWQYLASRNVWGFGAKGLRFDPGWVVWYYFIPILNLFRPYQVMKETWRASSDPENWRGQHPGIMVEVWWALTLLDAFLGRAIQSTYASEHGLIIAIAFDTAQIGVNVVTLMLVKEITGMQVALVRGEGGSMRTEPVVSTWWPEDKTEHVDTGEIHSEQTLQPSTGEETVLLGPEGAGETSDRESSRTDPMNDPVVGWLVVIAGPGRGTAHPLGRGRNGIGRGPDSRICLDYGDMTMSRKDHAIVTYDPKGGRYYIQEGNGVGLTYLDQELVNKPMSLKGRQEIGIGQTRLCFVPFCGSYFDWSDKVVKEKSMNGVLEGREDTGEGLEDSHV